jgi:cytochrome c-type biogenesis protein CcmH
MLFWVTAALLTFGACLAVLLPMTRPGGRQQPTREHDLEVYRDQLTEVERDARRGLIGPAEAEQARAEIGRRILRLASRDEAPIRGSGGVARWAGLAAVLAVPLVSWSIYAALGSPDLPSQPLRERLAANPAGKTLDELVARAEAHLAKNPSDGRGWEVVAPVYVRMGRYDEAVRAYRNAISFLGANAAREAGLGEALAAAAGGRIEGEALAAFERALSLEPEDAQARYYLAYADAQAGRTAEAAAAWRALAQSAPAGSPWRQAAEQALRQAEAAGPTKEQVDAAAAMSTDERGAMIEGMVGSLDARLRQNPRDPEGWKRLIRSYMVLGRAAEARHALGRGIEAFGAGTAEAQELQAFAAALEIESETQ